MRALSRRGPADRKGRDRGSRTADEHAPKLARAAPAGTTRRGGDRVGGRAWLLVLLVGAVTFAVYAPSLFNGFVDWDDDKNLLENLSYRGLGPAQLQWMWTTFHLGPYQPLSWMTYGLDYVVWGMKPLGYHLTSIALHALAAALFAVLVARLFAMVKPGDPRGETGVWGATAFGALAALVWSLHPLRVEVVSWATERREVLCGVFMLLALLSHVTGRRLILTGLAALAAMLSKGTAIVIPVLLVLIDLHRDMPESLRGWPAAIVRSLRRVWPLFGLSLVFGVLAIMGQRQAEAVSGLERIGLLDRFALLGNALGFYALRTIWPSRLAPIYEMSSDLSSVRTGAAVSLVLLVAAGFVFARIPRVRCLLLVLVVYVVFVAPVGGLLQVGAQVAADRYAYAAGWALSLLGASLVYSVVLVLRHDPKDPMGPRIGPWSRLLPASVDVLIFACLVAAPLAIRCVQQQRIWRDSTSLWTHQLLAYPDTAVAHYSLARLRVTGEPGEASDRWAEPHYREALRVRPDYPEAYRGLANSLRRLGRRDEAIQVYRDGLLIAPRSGPLLYGLAIADWESGRGDEAIARLRELERVTPVTADSHLVLARALAAHGEGREAVAAYERAIAAPTDSPAVAPMELAWLLATHPDDRVRDGRRAAELARRADDLGRELAARGGLALRSGLDWRLARTLAAALAESGDFDGAAAVLREKAPLFPPERQAEVDAWLAGFARREPVRVTPAFP